MDAHQKEMLQRIGSKIRLERNRVGLSLEALAKKVGISKMTLQRIETGASPPSVITLAEISFQLKQPLERLIREGEPSVVLLKQAEQGTLFDPESGIRVLAPKGMISDRITITYAELAQGTQIDTHRNNGFEWAFIFSGSAAVSVGNKQFSVEEGDAIFYDAHFPHSIEVYETVRYVALFLRDE